MKVTRREFVQGGLATFTVGFLAPALLTKMAHAQAAVDRNLVVLYLDGGVDGLSVLVPYQDSFYYSQRPSLAVPPDQVMQIGADAGGTQLGFHPRLTGLKGIWDQGKLAIIQRVGYTNSSRSHFEGTDIWSTADVTSNTRFGWLGRYLDGLGPLDPLYAWNAGGTLPRTLMSPNYLAPSIPNIGSYNYSQANGERAFAQQISSHVPVNQPHVAFAQKTMADAFATVDRVQSVGTYVPSAGVAYPTTGLGNAMKMIAGAITQNVGTKVFFVRTGGFDTHANQGTLNGSFNDLIANVDACLAAFYQDLANQGAIDNTLIVELSEFGRRIKENASAGLDHGAASNLLVLGGSVNGGLYGTAPNLNPDPMNPTLESRGRDVRFETDFRSIYAAVADNWLNTNSEQLLGGNFRNAALSFIA